MNRSAYIAIALLAFLSLWQRAGADEVDRYIMQGIDQLYSVRFDDAARSFERAIAADRGDPRGYFYRANIHLWGYMFDQRPEQLDLFLKVGDEGIRAAERRLDANPRDSRAKLFLGMIYGYRAIANAKAENFMAAAISARTCHDRLDEVVRSDPKAYDAYLGLGLFHFLFGSVPKAAQFMVGLGGIKGDAKLGLREIGTVADRGTYFRNDAQLILALLQVYYLDDVNRGLGTLEKIAAKYPKNVAILYVIANVYADEYQPAKAIGYYERVIRQGNDDFKMFTDLSYGHCGIAYFMSNDFDRAKLYLQKFIKNSREKTYRAYAWYLLGLCFEMEGNRANALKAYDYVLKSPGYSSPEDQAARRRATVLRKTPPTEGDMLAIRALNAVEGGDFAAAKNYAHRILGGSRPTPDQRAQAYYALGRALHEQGDCHGAVKSYGDAIAMGSRRETWITPYSYYYMAECNLKLGDQEKWRTNVGLAKQFSGYDNEQQLRFKMERDVTMID